MVYSEYKVSFVDNGYRSGAAFYAKEHPANLPSYHMNTKKFQYTTNEAASRLRCIVFDKLSVRARL